MPLKVVNANIVLLATHTPAIITADWVEKRGIITEKQVQAVNTHTFSIFESQNYLLTVEPMRLKLSSNKVVNEDVLRGIKEGILNYVKNFAGLDYKAFGLNYEFVRILEPSERYIVDASIEYRSKVNIKTVFNEHARLQLGSIIYAEKPPYVLRLVVEPIKNGIKYNFNYHHEVKDMNIEEIKRYLSTFTDKFDESKSIIARIEGRETL